ncbi:uncharacterized protein EKO05_0006141 [Ascochyta rabiei]|uniref:uncharacterized protein n=1 Tax=Didymella rabiei TaxID=5454 RepID=UPI0021FB2AEA|nr:uncharacterized protein EKO05_0006141 [Ascochyta rabiei]UPX15701.1 hypothetical protein EKO05_0006141 [Ascochyta rabiei]
MLCSSAFNNGSAYSVNLLAGYPAFYGLFAVVSYWSQVMLLDCPPSLPLHPFAFLQQSRPRFC